MTDFRACVRAMAWGAGLSLLAVSSTAAQRTRQPRLLSGPMFSSPQFPNSDGVAVESADLDGDGDDDLVSVNNAGTVAVLLNPGDGDFHPAVIYPTGGTGSGAIGIGDMDGDGDPDLAVTNHTEQTVAILMNDGAGVFAMASLYFAGIDPVGVAIADLNGDQALDLAVKATFGVSVLLNLGGGTFAPKVSYAVGISPPSLVATDLNGDGDVDFATIPNGDVSILLNNGDGTFFGPGVLRPSLFADILDGADLDQDGFTDLILLDFSGEASWFKNNGDLTFGPEVPLPVGDQPFAVATGDFNGNGTRDLSVVTRENGFTVSVFDNNGDGTFAPPVEYIGGLPWVGGTLPDHGRMAATADPDGDGDLDIVFCFGTPVTVLLNRNNKGFEVSTPIPSSVTGEYGPHLEDLSGDGWPDLVVIDTASNAAKVYLNDRTGALLPAGSYPTGTNTDHIETVDVDGDGDLDLAAADCGSNSVSILKNQGDGTFAAAAFYAAGDCPGSVAAGDLDGDGSQDLVVTHHSLGASLGVLLNDGGGAFAPAIGLGSTNFTWSVVVQDLDGDGDNDLAVGARGETFIMLNNGDATFVEGPHYPFLTTDSVTVVGGDLDGDGDVDLATTEGILLNDGSAAFAYGRVYSVGSIQTFTFQQRPLAVIDMDVDGDLDVVAYDDTDRAILIFSNRGDGTFGPERQFASWWSFLSIACADLDRDGGPDVVVTGNQSWVMRNRSRRLEIKRRRGNRLAW